VNRLRALFRTVLQLEDTPHRVALAFAIGIFIAFFPILGIHTALALLIAFAFRLNKVAILTGAWVNNPWTLAPMYVAGTVVGAEIMGVSSEGLSEVDWSLHGRPFYEALFETVRPLVLPFLLGNLILGVAGGVVAYFVLRTVLTRRQVSAPVGPTP
jgi:uncharacterized protein